MTEVKLCGMCGRVEASETCSECGVALCTACIQEVTIPEESLGYQVQGASISPIRRGTQVKKVCKKCLTEVDFI